MRSKTGIILLSAVCGSHYLTFPAPLSLQRWRDHISDLIPSARHGEIQGRKSASFLSSFLFPLLFLNNHLFIYFIYFIDSREKKGARKRRGEGRREREGEREKERDWLPPAHTPTRD